MVWRLLTAVGNKQRVIDMCLCLRVVRASVRACARGCLRECVSVCVRVCACVCVLCV